MDDGQKIDAMIAGGLQIIREVIETVRPTQIVAAYSSGDDSSVSTHFCLENFPDAFAFNADTMVGLKPSRCHLQAVCERFKWNLEIGQAHAEGPPQKMRVPRNDGSGKKKLVPFDATSVCPAGRWTDGATAYEEFCLNFGFPGRGRPQHARMYQRLKERPIRRMLQRFKASPVDGRPKVLIVSGIRADESSIRAGYKRAWAPGYFGDVWVNPFYWSTAADFEAYRQEFGIPRNPVKRRCGISGECCCGTYGDYDERQAYAEADPPFVVYLGELEVRVQSNGFPWGWGESPPRWWVEERRDKKNGQLRMFEDGECSTFQPMCVGCNSGRR